MASRRTEDEKTGEDGAGTAGGSAQRLDKWLWFVRAIKTRTQAAALVLDGKVRVNRARVTKPSFTVRAGDVLTLAFRGKVQILRVLAPGHRRGPAEEAKQLYELIEARQTNVAPHPSAGVAKREPGSGRPSKRDRRLTERLTEQK